MTFFNLRSLLGLILFGLISLSMSPLSAAEHSHPIDRSKDCYACHEDFDHDTFETLEDEVCGACHRGAAIQRTALKVGLSAPRPNLAIEKTAGIPGMVLPMRYEQSRYGDLPNEMVKVPAGEFILGYDNRMPDEGPAHHVTLPAYMIDKYEVTNLQYKRFIDQAKHRSPSHFKNRRFPAGEADHPVTYVSWHDAKAYCEWVGKRLPTNAEWEKAARGGDGRVYPWGDEYGIEKANSSMLWKSLKLEGSTTPVGAFPQGISPYGAYDMAGNVWEWTSSWYEPYPGNETPSEAYGKNYRTLKGGSWWDCSFYQCGISAPVFNRSFFSAHMRNETFGFRCAKDVDE
jgi:formylglycine-generating enzyme required for sulfatase activity